MPKLYSFSILFVILFGLNNSALCSYRLTKNMKFNDYDMEKIIKNSFGFFSKTEKIDFKEGKVYRKIDEPFLYNEEINKILKNSTNIPSTRKVEDLDFDNDIIRFKK